MQFWSEFWQEIGITGPRALSVVAGSAVMYLAFTIVLRFWGQRLFANRSGTGLAVALVLGAVFGRSMLGPGPTLMGGLVCVVTLVLLEGIFGAGRRAGLLGHRRPILIFDHGIFDHQAMRRYHLHQHVVWARLRQAGVTDLDDVSAIILEADGGLSVLRGETEARLLSRVRGAERLTG